MQEDYKFKAKKPAQAKVSQKQKTKWLGVQLKWQSACLACADSGFSPWYQKKKKKTAH
jgi:hypothetical protein